MQAHTIDRRRALEVLAHRALASPRLSVEEALADLSPLYRDDANAAFSEFMVTLAWRCAATDACQADDWKVAEVLDGKVGHRTPPAVLKPIYTRLMATARARAALAARDYESFALHRIDEDLDHAISDYLSARTLGDRPADPGEGLEATTHVRDAWELLELEANRASSLVYLRLEAELLEFTVAAWRLCDAARIRLAGGTR